jgi:hypothetical protein
MNGAYRVPLRAFTIATLERKLFSFARFGVGRSTTSFGWKDYRYGYQDSQGQRHDLREPPLAPTSRPTNTSAG